jgi:hypothetical protein
MITWFATLRAARSIALANSASSAAMSSTTRLSGSRSTVNFTPERPFSRRIGGRAGASRRQKYACENRPLALPRSWGLPRRPVTGRRV